MGAYLNKPVTDKETEAGENRRVRFAATTMQGWRVNQEDAHNCILEFDVDCSLFAVYDGHGGSEVARYTALHLPDFLKQKTSWKEGDYQKALDEAFLEFDELLRSEDVLKELKVLAGVAGATRNENSDDEDKDALCEEASMPLESLLEKYGFAFRRDRNGRAVINLEDLHALREQHERFVGGVEDDEKGKENGGEEKDGETSETLDDEDGVINTRQEEKKKKRVCESPIGEAAKRTKSSENSDEKEDEPSTATARRHCFSESHSSNCTTSDDAAQNNGHATARRERASKSESEAAEMVKEGNEETKDGPDMRQIAEQCRSTDKPQPSATPETQTAVSSDSEQSVDDDYNEDEEMSEDEEESEEVDEDEPAYSGPSGDTPGEDSGTTACVLLLFKDKVIVANAGDSRAVLCRKGTAVDLSVDHKPEDESEKARIEAAGGEISMDGRVNGGLNLSRALGDHFYKKNDSLPLKDQMISAQPDVTVHSIKPEDEFVVIACDGIWNSLSSQEAVDFIRKRISGGVPLRDICEQMCNECLSPNTAGDGTGCDNMTVIVAELLRE
uniref:protein-serine/threonine phosphatase n=1 Tax=Parascaris univalens TaxID=6257 RepID=A0A915CE89_PARUN